MASIDLSVVIATRDRPAALAVAVERLMAQQVAATTYEIIVVDDGSVPFARVPEDDREPKCTLIRREGLGRSAARNAGGHAAQGDVLVFIDDDIYVKDGFLQRHLVAHQEWSDSLAVGAIELPEEAQLTPFGRFRQRLENSGVPRSRGLTLMRNFCAAGNMSIPRHTFHRLGGFDESMESGEDQDLALRHTAQGGRIVFLPKAEAIHNDSALDIQSYCLRSEWGMERMFPFCRRHPAWPDNTAREQVNGRTRLGREAFGLSLRKALKLSLGKRPALASLFAITSLLELSAPRTRVLDWFYRVLLGVHIFRGYRRGLRRYTSSEKASPANSSSPVPGELEIDA